MDIENLYTNIETDMGMGAVRRILEKYPDKSRPDQELLDLLQLNLTHNDFVFDGQIFLQIKGTAMGKRFSVLPLKLTTITEHIEIHGTQIKYIKKKEMK